LKLTVLVDNNTYIDQYYFGEPAAAFYIEEGGARVLLDTGYSHILLPNAEAMGIDLSRLTHIVLSHGHDDHTRGLQFLREKIDLSDKQLIAHPDTFLPKYNFGRPTGCPYREAEIAAMCRYVPCTAPYAITDRLLFLGHIPRVTDFENKRPVGAVERDGVRQDDWLTEDSALVYRSDDGLFIITGCSHSGICNIIEHAMQVCGDRRIAGVLGGFHLFEVNEQTKKTIAYFEERKIGVLYPSHCVSLSVRAEMLRTLPVIETGVGLTLEVK